THYAKGEASALSLPRSALHWRRHAATSERHVGTQHAHASIDPAAPYLRVSDRRGGAIPGQAHQAHRPASRRQRHRHGRAHPRRRARELGQQIVIDNRPGGALTIGLDLTANAEPAGYTICMGPMGALAIPRHMVAKLPYEIERDFQPIALATRGHLLLAVSPTLPFKSVQDIIDHAKANPGKLLNASSSNGSPGHVGGELFKYMSGTDIVHVPYRGGAAAINDLIAGRVHLMFESLNSVAPRARSCAVGDVGVSGPGGS